MNRKRKTDFYPYLYLAPALISMIFLTLYPIIKTIYISFTNMNVQRLNNPDFIKFENYSKILFGPLKDSFIPMFIWTLTFAGLTCLIGYALGLMLALILNNKNIKERAVYKAILVLPWALPGTIALLSWQGLFNTEYGGINKLLMSLGIISSKIPWLQNVTLARIAILISSVWFTVPFMMNACLGALTSIPQDYYEAAEIDGANKWQKFVKITMPTLAPATYPLVISSFAHNFNNFSGIYMITGGGPTGKSVWAGGTDILISSAYKLVGEGMQAYGLASALAVLVFIIIGSITFVQMKLSGQFKEVN
ncbi:carbohydrate ABC transporter permease [Desnuesiella massiliensis]|uniref:carbohydrate ABC transporter permease n=1 Tax=Desnuesiella massiliensis TaxID=1650662 RepID=UPI0006E1A8FB|nr:sugar ABC transporter permease [Desnuesiella massiliensis]